MKASARPKHLRLVAYALQLAALTSASNREFDAWLKARDPQSGIRDFEAVDALAQKAGLRLQADVEMPANNRCLVWRRVA